MIWLLNLMKTFDLPLEDHTVSTIKYRQNAEYLKQCEKEGRATVFDSHLQQKTTDIIVLLTIGVNGYSKVVRKSLIIALLGARG